MMKIKVKNKIANVYTPYNPEFVKKIKGIGGAKWNGSEKCWAVPEIAIEAVRKIMVDVYGYSDVKENETLSLKLIFNEEVSSFCSDVVLFGKIISHASGRDSGARVGDDVAFISGGARSGGSVKNWYSRVENGSVVVLSNVNKNIYENFQLEFDVAVEILENNNNNKQELLEEKERLKKRIKEINKLLKKCDE